MTGEIRLIETNVLVQAYTVSDDTKHAMALSVLSGFGTVKELRLLSRTSANFSLQPGAKMKMQPELMNGPSYCRTEQTAYES
jgi:hypothetical protein